MSNDREKNEKIKCKNCGSDDVEIIARVPWSTNGLYSQGKVGIKCRKCGFFQPIGDKNVSIDRG
jgi:uncharacterized Zn finger protein